MSRCENGYALKRGTSQPVTVRRLKEKKKNPNSSVCAELSKQTGRRSSLVSSQIYFFFPSLCLFDLRAHQPGALGLDFSKSSAPGVLPSAVCALTLFPRLRKRRISALARELGGKNCAAARAGERASEQASHRPHRLTADVTAEWRKTEPFPLRPPLPREARPRT